MNRPTTWGRILKPEIDRRRLNLITEREAEAILRSHGCRMYEREEAARRGVPSWRVALAASMRSIGFELRGRNTTTVRFRRKMAPAPTAPAQTGPEVYSVRRRSPSIEGGAA